MDKGLTLPNREYNFIRLPIDTRDLVLDILENQYEYGKIIKQTDAMTKFRSDNNIPEGSSIKLGPVNFVYNGRKLCDQFDFLGVTFMTYK